MFEPNCIKMEISIMEIKIFKSRMKKATKQKGIAGMLM